MDYGSLINFIGNQKSPMQTFMEEMHKGEEGRLKEAEAKKAEAQAKLPFGGANVPGAAGQIVGLEMVKQMYGENSPQYQQAQKAFSLGQEGVQSRVNYQNSLTENAGKRFSTPLAKTAQEYEDIKNGKLPGTKIPLTPEQQQQYLGMYGNDLLKKTTDTDTRKKNLYAHNIDITLSNINPEALTRYSGLKGGVALLEEKRKDLQGNPSPQYLEYQRSLTAAKTLAKQVRQFYGDSITSGVQEGLKKLTDPSEWLKSPKTALANYNAFVNILRSESKTYQQAAQSPGVYSGNAAELQNQPEAVNEGMAQVSNPQIGGNTPKKKLKIENGQLVEDNS